MSYFVTGATGFIGRYLVSKLLERKGTAATNKIHVLVIATFWLNYASARGDKDEHEAIRAGIVQVMMLLAPFLRDAERVHLNTLTRAYLD